MWDRYSENTGSGIWLHGVKGDEFIRPLLDSDGCIVLSNENVERLSKYLKVGYTKVISVPKINWVKASVLSRDRDEIVALMNSWLAAWETRDPEPYLQFYSRKFSDTEKNYEDWVSYKTRVNPSKRHIRVRYSDMGIYAYPGQENLAMVEFYQDYTSDNYHSRGWKRLLWRKEGDGKWRIIYEKGG